MVSIPSWLPATITPGIGELRRSMASLSLRRCWIEPSSVWIQRTTSTQRPGGEQGTHLEIGIQTWEVGQLFTLFTSKLGKVGLRIQSLVHSQPISTWCHGCHGPLDQAPAEEWGLGLPYFEGKPVPLKAAKVLMGWYLDISWDYWNILEYIGIYIYILEFTSAKILPRSVFNNHSFLVVFSCFFVIQLGKNSTICVRWIRCFLRFSTGGSLMPCVIYALLLASLP